MSSPSLVDIVIPIWNQKATTQRCLESLLESTPEAVILILVDNGSESETTTYLKDFEKRSPLPVKLIRNEVNLGFIQGTNQGIRAGNSPWVCLLNNDTIVTPGWLTEMLTVAQADLSIGLVNPTSNSLGISPEGEPLRNFAQKLRKQSGESTPLTTALGFCLLVSRAIMESVGGLDESYGMGYFDDDDLSRKIVQKGLRCVRACGSYVYHEEKVSFRNLSPDTVAFETNRALFEKRWGRRLRILWIAGVHPDQTNLLTQVGQQLLAQGNWIVLAADPQDPPATLQNHAQIATLKLHPSFWRIQTLWRLLTKWKKPFELVIGFDRTCSSWVKKTQGLHQACLLEEPSAQTILQTCQNLSNSP